MRYFLYKQLHRGDTHVWLLDIQVEPGINGNPLVDAHQIIGLISVPNPVGSSLLQKTAIWFDELKSDFGIWSRGRGLIFKTDTLRHLNIQNVSSFRGEAMFDEASLEVTDIELGTRHFSLGHCLPKRPLMSAQSNRDFISAEWLELARHPIFKERFESLIKYYGFCSPY